MMNPAERDQVIKLVGAAVYSLPDVMNFEQAQACLTAVGILALEFVAYQRPHSGLLPFLA
jgi:presenilin-like A22 family membrane protease